MALPGCPYPPTMDKNGQIAVTAEFAMHMAHVVGHVGVAIGINPIVTLEKQLLHMVWNLVYSG